MGRNPASCHSAVPSKKSRVLPDSAAVRPRTKGRPKPDAAGFGESVESVKSPISNTQHKTQTARKNCFLVSCPQERREAQTTTGARNTLLFEQSPRARTTSALSSLSQDSSQYTCSSCPVVLCLNLIFGLSGWNSCAAYPNIQALPPVGPDEGEESRGVWASVRGPILLERQGRGATAVRAR